MERQLCGLRISLFVAGLRLPNTYFAEVKPVLVCIAIIKGL